MDCFHTLFKTRTYKRRQLIAQVMAVAMASEAGTNHQPSLMCLKRRWLVKDKKQALLLAIELQDILNDAGLKENILCEAETGYIKLISHRDFSNFIIRSQPL